ncbi:MAG: ABC transporter ATP-binding protein [Burkholderiaceae bacterium]
MSTRVPGLSEKQGDTVLSVHELSVQIASELGVTDAVRHLSMAIERGQTFALVGESGSGKSMTALALLRLLPEAGRLARGSVRLGDTDLEYLPERDMRRIRGGRIGIIFQEPSTSLNPVMTIGEQLYETLRRHTSYRGQALRERAAWWLERVGIPNARARLSDYPFQFSGGQKQRIMIAIALAAEPVLLIADEPTTALDVTVQAQILALLADIQAEMGLAILLITHDLAVVKQVADVVALMRRGEIVETQPCAAFFSAPRHPYARELLAAIPTFEKRGAALSPQTVAAQPPRATPGNGPVLSVQGLSVAYTRKKRLFGPRVAPVPVVSDLSFTLHAGETLALLGESGCGKTTTAKALLRLLDKQALISGQASLLGSALLTARGNALRQARKSLQIVFQDPYASLDPRMMVGDILDEGMTALRSELPRAQRRAHVARLLDRVGLPADTVHRYPHEFSGGQRQRIAIARALAVEPAVLVCDEPTSALDVSVQAQILDLLRELQAELGIAYLFITHNFGVVEYLADRVAIMDGGKIIEIGEAASVLKHPAQEQTRRLLAAVPRL